MPRKEVKKRKRANDVVDQVAATPADEDGSTVDAVTKIPKVEATEATATPESHEVPADQTPAEDHNVSTANNSNNGDDININDDHSNEIGDDAPPPAAMDAPADGAKEPPASTIPQLIPPAPMRDLPEDEEFVSLAAIQVVPMMNRSSEAQNGLLREPAPPTSIQRVTQPGTLAPAMPMALLELLSG